MMMAGRTRMQRVVTQVAIALGASVQPFTKMTPSVSSVVSARGGVDSTWLTKVPKETSKGSAFSRMRRVPAGQGCAPAHRVSPASCKPKPYFYTELTVSLPWDYKKG